MAQTYTAGFLAVAFGNNKSMGAILNGSGSGRIVRVKRIWILNNQTSAVTGVLTTFALKRSSAQSGGTSVTPTKHDTNSEALPGQVLVATGATVTQTSDVAMRQWVWSNDEPAAGTGTSDEFECLVPLNCVWDSATGDADLEPITLREGQGIDVRHTGTTTVGVCDIFVEFTLASS
jgi:hypothetical protein